MRLTFLRNWLVALLVCATLAVAQAQSPIRYIYDELGRLIGVVDASGAAAIYTYDAVGNLLSITRQISGVVSILHMSPDSGHTGQDVTIYGTGFSATPSQNTVTFNGTTATVTASTTTSIAVTVPSGAATGTIAVTSPSGSASSGSSFTVVSSTAPSITSFTPTVGAVGAAVTISGVNFDSTLLNNRLALNLTRAWPGSGTTNSLATTVPAGAGSGKILISTPLGSASSAADFYVPPPPFIASDVVFTDRVAFGGSKSVAIPTSGKIGLVIFDGVAGQRVSLKAVSGPIGTIKIHRPDLTVVEQAGIGVLTILLEPPLLTHTGTYSTLVDPSNTGTGTTTLTLYEVPADFTGTITAGDASATAVQVTTTVPGQNGRLSFSALANDRVAVWISSGPTGSVSIVEPDGTTHASANITSLAQFLDTTTLAASGDYSLFVDFNAANAGSVSLKLYSVPADVVDTITATQSGSSAGVTITVPGQNGILTFSGSANQRVSVRTSSSSPAGTVSLRRPDGTVQASASTGFLASFIDTQVLASTDTYSIKFDPSGTNVGSTTITLFDVPADATGTVTVGGSAQTLTLGTPGQNGSLTFGGTQGQTVTVRATNNAIGTSGTRGPTTVRLLKPDGTQLTSITSSALNFNLSPQTLPSTGTYTIVVDPSGAHAGTIDIQVTNP